METCYLFSHFLYDVIQSIKMSDIIKDHIREHTHLSCKCGRSWISFLVVSNQRLKLVFAASLLNMKHDEPKAKNGWLRVREMCMRGALLFN